MKNEETRTERPYTLLAPGNHTLTIKAYDVVEFSEDKKTLELLLQCPFFGHLAQASIWLQHTSMFWLNQHKKLLNELQHATGIHIATDDDFSLLLDKSVSVLLKEFENKMTSSFLNSSISVCRFFPVKAEEHDPNETLEQKVERMQNWMEQYVKPNTEPVIVNKPDPEQIHQNLIDNVIETASESAKNYASKLQKLQERLC